jgi:hypothetical protein
MLPQRPWAWDGRPYLGVVHGMVGILAQIVLSEAATLGALLDLQGGEGNWHVIEAKELGLVQFCQGAPGFVLSLLAVRPLPGSTRRWRGRAN